MKRLPWLKLYDDYVSSPSHADLDPHAFAMGIGVMLLVRSTCDALDELQPWALLPTGKPVTAAGIGLKMHEPDVAKVERSLLALLDTGTFVRREDGAYGMPGFADKQRGESTERAAKSKALKAAAATDATVVQIAASATSTRPAERRVVPVLVASTPDPAAAARATAIVDLTEKLAYGWDNRPPPTPKGLPRLRAHRSGLDGLLATGMTPAEILEAVVGVAELVEFGELPPTDWTGTKVFSGWLDGMRIKHAEWSRAKARKVAALAAVPDAESAPPMDFEAIERAAAAEVARMKGQQPCTS